MMMLIVLLLAMIVWLFKGMKDDQERIQALKKHSDWLVDQMAEIQASNQWMSDVIQLQDKELEALRERRRK